MPKELKTSCLHVFNYSFHNNITLFEVESQWCYVSLCWQLTGVVSSRAHFPLAALYLQVSAELCMKRFCDSMSMNCFVFVLQLVAAVWLVRLLPSGTWQRAGFHTQLIEEQQASCPGTCRNGGWEHPVRGRVRAEHTLLSEVVFTITLEQLVLIIEDHCDLSQKSVVGRLKISWSDKIRLVELSYFFEYVEIICVYVV